MPIQAKFWKVRKTKTSTIKTSATAQGYYSVLLNIITLSVGMMMMVIIFLRKSSLEVIKNLPYYDGNFFLIGVNFSRLNICGSQSFSLKSNIITFY